MAETRAAATLRASLLLTTGSFAPILALVACGVHHFIKYSRKYSRWVPSLAKRGERRIATGSLGRPSPAKAGRTRSLECFGAAGNLRDGTRPLRATSDCRLLPHGFAVPSPSRSPALRWRHRTETRPAALDCRAKGERS